VEMFPTLLRLHGKSNDYLVKYDSITRLFLLPKGDDQNFAFVVRFSSLISSFFFFDPSKMKLINIFINLGRITFTNSSRKNKISISYFPIF